MFDWNWSCEVKCFHLKKTFCITSYLLKWKKIGTSFIHLANNMVLPVALGCWDLATENSFNSLSRKHVTKITLWLTLVYFPYIYSQGKQVTASAEQWEYCTFPFTIINVALKIKWRLLCFLKMSRSLQVAKGSTIYKIETSYTKEICNSKNCFKIKMLCLITQMPSETQGFNTHVVLRATDSSFYIRIPQMSNDDMNLTSYLYIHVI